MADRRMVPRTLTAILLAAAAALLVSPPSEAGREILTLDTRPDVTVKVLRLTPEAPSNGTFVMFPGGDGKGHFAEDADGVRLGSNFLVRSAPLFVERGFAAAVVDVPSDRANGMDDRFRTSPEHAADIRKVLDRLSEQGAGSVFLAGTSRGTLSAAYLGASLKDGRVAGIVLTASIGATRVRRFSLSLFDLPVETISLPVLFVHHREDGCWASRFEDARQLWGRMPKLSPSEFIEVVGGDPPRSEPCQALSAHGFLGKERDVVAAIADWALGKPVPKRIGP